MSNLYSSAREAFLTGNLSWTSNTVKAVLVNGYTYSDAHAYLSDLGAAAVATSPALTSKTSSGGVADAADVTFPAVTGNSVEAIVLFADTGTASTSRLIAYVDNATGLPVTPTGGNITIQWDNGASRIFSL